NTLRHLCQGLRERGHRLEIIRPRQRLESVMHTQALGPEHTLVPGLPIPGYPDLRFGLPARTRLLRRWKRVRPDAVYVATEGPLGWSAVSAARALEIPVCSGFHTNFQSYSRYYGAGFLEKLITLYLRAFHNRTQTTLVPTRRMQSLLDRYGIERVRVWSRGVDCHRFTPARRDLALRKQWGLRPEDRAVLYVGRLAPEKNLSLAVSCFERVRQCHPKARFVLVGDGPMRKKLEARHPDYIFCGMQQGDDLARHYASGDLFLFPSKTDTFGNVVTEAMASGLAIVAFDDAAASEHIQHATNGMKVDLQADDQFILAALQLLDQPSLMRRVRDGARQDALELAWPSLIEQFETLLLTPGKETRAHAIKQGISLL
ncbi:MAG: glycosyltransferase family 1 protein, partial [Gammaproteobacteria bacterium]|nr:glycosyltransferase family 1 protein [Gammaproteobacteria bacterium]